MLKNTLMSVSVNRQLTWEMTKRDPKGLNKGSLFGYPWPVVSPPIHDGVYVAVMRAILLTNEYI